MRKTSNSQDDSYAGPDQAVIAIDGPTHCVGLKQGD